jgi:lipopolysaccharide transport system ATP-binding protein
MYVRLAFAVAAHLESEILIVDEVLAVGDAEFQKKCLGKMGDISKGEGRTVLFVSHNMAAIKNLCESSLFLKNGSIISSGTSAEVIDFYLSSGSNLERYYKSSDNNRLGDESVRLNTISIMDKNRSIQNSLTSESQLTIEVVYEILQEVKDLRVVANIMSIDGIEIFSTSDYKYQTESRIRKPGIYRSYFEIPGNIMNATHYHLSIDIDIPMIKSIVSNQLVSFSIDELINNELGITLARKPAGVIHPVFKWNVDLL